MIEIIEQDGDVVDFRATSPTVDVRVVARMTLDGDDLVLSGLHIQGSGPGTAGIAGLRQLARELGELCGAKRVIIVGGKRTSGAAPGHMPRSIVIDVGGQTP